MGIRRLNDRPYLYTSRFTVQDIVYRKILWDLNPKAESQYGISQTRSSFLVLLSKSQQSHSRSDPSLTIFPFQSVCWPWSIPTCFLITFLIRRLWSTAMYSPCPLEHPLAPEHHTQTFAKHLIIIVIALNTIRNLVLKARRGVAYFPTIVLMVWHFFSKSSTM